MFFYHYQDMVFGGWVGWGVGGGGYMGYDTSGSIISHKDDQHFGHAVSIVVDH
jgi:hypothetical protein